MSNIIKELEAEQMTRELPEFSPGDTVVSRESEGLVRIRWIDGDFVLSLVGVDEGYLRSQMQHVR